MNGTVSVGPAIQYAGLTVFPLFRTPDNGIEYLLSDEADPRRYGHRRGGK